MKKTLQIILIAALAANLQGKAAAFDMNSFLALADQAERTSALIMSIEGGAPAAEQKTADFISYCSFITGQTEASCEADQAG